MFKVHEVWLVFSKFGLNFFLRDLFRFFVYISYNLPPKNFFFFIQLAPEKNFFFHTTCPPGPPPQKKTLLFSCNLPPKKLFFIQHAPKNAMKNISQQNKRLRTINKPVEHTEFSGATIARHSFWKQTKMKHWCMNAILLHLTYSQS